MTTIPMDRLKSFLAEQSCDVYMSDIRYGQRILALGHGIGLPSPSLLQLIEQKKDLGPELLQLCSDIWQADRSADQDIEEISKLLVAGSRNPQRDLQILMLRYGSVSSGITNLDEISEHIAVSRQRITQIIQAYRHKAGLISVFSAPLYRATKQLSIEEMNRSSLDRHSTFLRHFVEISAKREPFAGTVPIDLFLEVTKACNQMLAKTGAIHAPTVAAFVTEKTMRPITASVVVDVAMKQPGFLWLSKQSKWFDLAGDDGDSNVICQSAARITGSSGMSIEKLYPKISAALASSQGNSSLFMAVPLDVMETLLRNKRTMFFVSKDIVRLKESINEFVQMTVAGIAQHQGLLAI